MRDGLVRKYTLAPSQRPYAVNFPTFKLDKPGSGSVEVIWVGRKRGVTTVTLGQLHLFSFREKFETLDDALAHADMRYGGMWMYQWDGERLNVEPTHALNPDEHALMAISLGYIADHLPALPEGPWDGWYYRRAR